MIILKNISKSYGGKAVLDNVNIEIPGSGVFGIFGASGQGKTTLIRLLCGLEKPDGGEIIMQKAVKVRDGDTPETLQKRVMRLAEWKILPAAAEKISDEIVRKKAEEK